MNQQLEKYLLGSMFAGIEAEVRSNGVFFHVAIVERKGKKLAVKKILTEANSLNDDVKDILQNIPAIVVVTGKGILYRTVTADRDSKPGLLLHRVLANAQAHDFFISSVYNEQAGHVVAVARKSMVNPIMAESEKHCWPISFSIGAGCIADILSLVGTKNEIICGNHTIQLKEEHISGISYSETEEKRENFIFGDQEIPSEGLVAFAAAFRLATGNHSAEESGTKREEFLYRKLFRSTVKAALIFLLLILTGNFFAFSHYHSLAEELQSRPEAGNGLNEKLNMLREQVATRTDFLKQTGLLSTNSYAWYADQLAHGMPDGIQLTRMNFSPLVKTAEEDTIGFHANSLEIAGSCDESIVLNSWLQALKNEKWIGSATIRSFEQDRAESKGEFILDLQL